VAVDGAAPSGNKAEAASLETRADALDALDIDSPLVDRGQAGGLTPDKVELAFDAAATVGFGASNALCYKMYGSSALYQTHEQIRSLCA
jgi:hypothetical protein